MREVTFMILHYKAFSFISGTIFVTEISLEVIKMVNIRGWLQDVLPSRLLLQNCPVFFSCSGPGILWTSITFLLSLFLHWGWASVLLLPRSAPPCPPGLISASYHSRPFYPILHLLPVWSVCICCRPLHYWVHFLATEFLLPYQFALPNMFCTAWPPPGGILGAGSFCMWESSPCFR